MTILAKLVAIQNEPLGFINYVFEIINQPEQEIHKTKYIDCVRYNNWQCRDLKLNDAGYVVIERVEAGKDTWFDGINLNFYKSTHNHFIKFIPCGESREEEYVL